SGQVCFEESKIWGAPCPAVRDMGLYPPSHRTSCFESTVYATKWNCPTSRKPREVGHPRVLVDVDNILVREKWATRPTRIPDNTIMRLGTKLKAERPLPWSRKLRRN